jgi:hypothetical protein
MDYIVDTKRRDLVLDAILDRYRRGAYPYNLKRTMLAVLKMPERLERGGEDEARWWFFCCMLMRGGVDSDTALRALSIMYDRQMQRGGLWPFNPHKAALLTEDQLTGLIKDAGTGLERYARDWINSARIMVERFDGSVLKMMDSFDADYETAAMILRNQGNSGFPGFQYKMVSMLLFFVTEAKLIAYFPYPPPIDFHLQRVAVATEIVSRDDGKWILANSQKEQDRLQEALRDTYLEYIAQTGIRSNELSDALWLLSRMLCRRAPGNRTTQPKTDKIGRSRPVLIPGADFTTTRDLRKHDASCGRCPVQSQCKYNVSSGHYYVKGQTRIIGEREESPVNLLFDPDTGNDKVKVFRKPLKPKLSKEEQDAKRQAATATKAKAKEAQTVLLPIEAD